MTDIRTHVDDNGRVLIPSQIRKEFNIKKGDVFVMRAVSGEIKMISLDKAIKDAQDLVRKYVPENVSLVGELLQSRREEYLKEEGKV